MNRSVIVASGAVEAIGGPQLAVDVTKPNQPGAHRVGRVFADRACHMQPGGGTLGELADLIRGQRLLPAAVGAALLGECDAFTLAFADQRVRTRRTRP